MTLDDLTLDYNQFAQIREILKKNQEKLVLNDELDDFSDDYKDESNSLTENNDNFCEMLSPDEISLLNILVKQSNGSALQLKKALLSYPTYKTMFENINEKAIDFFGETIVENDDELPWMDDEYISEMEKQFSAYQK